MLDNCYDQPSIQLEGETSYNPIDIQAATIFDLTVLSQVSNTSKAVIGVSVGEEDWACRAGGSRDTSVMMMSFSLWIKMTCHGLKCDDDVILTAELNDVSWVLWGWVGGGKALMMEIKK